MNNFIMWKNLFAPQHLKWRWLFCISISIYLYSFITFCEPLQDDKLTYTWASVDDYLQHVLINFMSTMSSCAVAIITLPHYLPHYFLPENLTFKRFSFLSLSTSLVIEINYFFVAHFFFHFELSLAWFLIFMLKVTVINFLFVGVPFVFVFITLFNHFIDVPQRTLTLLKEPQFENSQTYDVEKPVTELTDLTPSQYEEGKRHIVLHFNDISNRKRLALPLDRLYYITSSQNYIEIFYKNQQGKLSSQLLRNTLKMVEEELMTDTNLPLVRCHKAFIVNYDKVLELRGIASKNAHFILMDTDTTIPVSRHKFADFDNRSKFIVNKVNF